MNAFQCKQVYRSLKQTLNLTDNSEEQINMIEKFIYESPAVEIIETLAKGVLCASNADLELDMNPEEGNMQIAGRAGNDVLCHARY